MNNKEFKKKYFKDFRSYPDDEILYVPICELNKTINVKNIHNLVVDYIPHDKVKTMYYISDGTEGQLLKIKLINDTYKYCSVYIKHKRGDEYYGHLLNCLEPWMKLIFHKGEWLFINNN